MKFLIPFLLLTNVALSQIVQSSCETTDTFKSSADADLLLYEYIVREELDLIDSIQLPNEMSEKICSSLTAVYNADALAVHDTIFNIYNISPFYYKHVNRLTLGVNDTTLVWFENLANNTIPTGDNTLDSLLNLYPAEIYEVRKDWGYITIEFYQGYNINLLSKEFEKIPNLRYSETLSGDGDGNHITASISNDTTILSYSRGFGDCPAGCIWRQYWDFKVYANCIVEYCGKRGDFLDSTNDISQSEIITYPNPVSDKMYFDISDRHTLKSVDLYSASGNKVTTFTLEKNHENSIDISSLPKGIYLLSLNFDSGNLIKKIIKI